MAAEEANALPFMGPKEVPETYEVPQDKAGVVCNDMLAKGYSILGEHINHTFRLISDSFFGENCSSQIDEMKAIIKKIAIKAHEKIGRVGDNAFPLPEVLVDALEYLDIPWPPVL